MAKIKDTDYLAISARIRAMENGLLNRERMEQLLEARSQEDTVKLLQECGYPEFDAGRPEEMDKAIAEIREATLRDLSDGAPDARFFDFFRVRYDYHNAKAAVKALALGTDAASMLSGLGRVPAAELLEAVRPVDFGGLVEGRVHGHDCADEEDHVLAQVAPEGCSHQHDVVQPLGLLAVLFIPEDILPAEENLSALDLPRRHLDKLQRRHLCHGFPASGFTDDGNDLSFIHVKTDAVHRLNISVICFESRPQVFDLVEMPATVLFLTHFRNLPISHPRASDQERRADRPRSD